MNNQEAKEYYYNFLTNQSTQWNGLKALPVKGKISLAFKKEDEKKNMDLGSIITEYLQAGKKVYFWSDHHFYHKNIIEYSNRPFNTMDEMISTMIKNYNSIVNDEDLVIFGGDIAFASDSITKGIINVLKGRKLLIYGNHDFQHGKPENISVFTESAICAVFPYVIGNRDYEILVTHYPITIDLPKNVINIHGHTHQHLMGDKRLNMCVEHTNYSPKSLEDVLEDFKY